MDMGMIFTISCVCVKYGRESSFPAKLLVVASELLQGIFDRGEHQGVDTLLISPGKVSQLFTQGKSNEKISDGQPFMQLVFDPLIAFMVLAMGAVSVSAGMWDIDFLPTRLISTLSQHMTTVLLSAPGHVPQSLSVTWQH